MQQLLQSIHQLLLCSHYLRACRCSIRAACDAPVARSITEITCGIMIDAPHLLAVIHLTSRPAVLTLLTMLFSSRVRSTHHVRALLRIHTSLCIELALTCTYIYMSFCIELALKQKPTLARTCRAYAAFNALVMRALIRRGRILSAFAGQSFRRLR